jgi:hypothetical protein
MGLLNAWRRDADLSSLASLEAARRGVFGRSPPRALRAHVRRGIATMAEPGSQMCTARQFEEPAYLSWCARLGVPVHWHRKQWEFIYILQVLEQQGALREGSRGLGFGVGVEPLPSIMATLGCTVTATDLPGQDERAQIWSDSGQHGSLLDQLLWPTICPEDVFRARVSFEAVDMTAIPDHLRDYDYTWSSCAYEHLGSIDAGLDFFEASLRCVRPGGIAVHTTELNLTSNSRTVDAGETVLFRRRDFERLALRLIKAGHEVLPINYDMGDRALDVHIDVAPYSENNHLKLALAEFVTTSFGMAVRKAA